MLQDVLDLRRVSRKHTSLLCVGRQLNVEQPHSLAVCNLNPRCLVRRDEIFALLQIVQHMLASTF